MKTMKRLGALLLVVAMVLALGVSAFASSSKQDSSDYEEDYTITISNTTEGKIYSAYQILDATWIDTDGDGKTDNVSYTISPDSPWFYIVSQGSNLNTENANPVFTLQAVYEAGYNASSENAEEHISYYTVVANDDRVDLDGNSGTDAIIDYLLFNINMITEEDPDYEGNEVSTGLAYIQTGVDGLTGDPVYALLVPALVDDYGNPYTEDKYKALYADEMTAYGCTEIIVANATGTGTGGKLVLDLGKDAAGYYFVTTTTGTTVSVTTADPDATIIDKNIISGGSTPPPGDGGDEPGDGTPWLDKYIVVSDAEGDPEDSGYVAEDDEHEYDYAIGDEVVFNITSDVPLYGDSNKSTPANGTEESNAVNNAELIYQYVFTDEMSDGVDIKIDKALVNVENTDSTGSSTSYIYVEDGKYYLTDYALDQWITLTDGEGNEYDFTKVTYHYSLELSDFVAVYYGADYDEDDLYTLDPNEAQSDEVTGEPVIAYYAASGFTLTYYTYDVDAYWDYLWSWACEMVWDYDNEKWKFDEDRLACLTSGEYPEEALEGAWDAAYGSKSAYTQYPATAEIMIAYDAVISDAAVYDNTNTVTMDYYVVSWDSYPPVPVIPEEDVPDTENPDPENPPENPYPDNPPDGPSDGTPGTHSGQTVTNDIFTWQLQINKVDGEDDTLPLKGAVFTLEGETLDRVRVTTYSFTLDNEYADYDATIVYYLVDGEYTEIANVSDALIAEAATSLYGTYYKTSNEYKALSDLSDEELTAALKNMYNVYYLVNGQYVAESSLTGSETNITGPYYYANGAYKLAGSLTTAEKAAAAANMYGEYYQIVSETYMTDLEIAYSQDQVDKLESDPYYYNNTSNNYMLESEYSGYSTNTRYYLVDGVFTPEEKVNDTTGLQSYYYNKNTGDFILRTEYEGYSAATEYYLVQVTKYTDKENGSLTDDEKAAALASEYGAYYKNSDNDYILVSDYDEYVSTQYWLLADGVTYVAEAPTDSTLDKYDAKNPGPYYRESSYIMEEAGSGEYCVTGTTDESGEVIFAGLAEGKYVLTEITAPDGYNVLSSPIYFEVKWYDTGEAYTDLDGSKKEVTEPVFVITFWESADSNTDGAKMDTETGNYWVATSVSEIPLGNLGNATYVETIENTAGTLLPGTGGIGTTIFYIIGGCLVIGAVVVLVTRRRVSKEEEAEA